MDSTVNDSSAAPPSVIDPSAEPPRRGRGRPRGSTAAVARLRRAERAAYDPAVIALALSSLRAGRSPSEVAAGLAELGVVVPPAVVASWAERFGHRRALSQV